MTVSQYSTKLENAITNCVGCIRNRTPRKLTRLLWTLLVTATLLFSTHFLYLYQDGHAPTSTANIVLSQNQQYPFFNVDSLINTDDMISEYTNRRVSLLQHTDSLSLADIESIVDSGIKGSVVDITAILHYSDNEIGGVASIKAQIKSILAQSVQPKQIWVVCNSNKPQKTLQQKFEIRDNIKVKLIPYEQQDNADNSPLLLRDIPWILQPTFTIPTDYVWILEPGVIPDADYLYYTYGLLNTEKYKHTLIGYDASLFSIKNSSPHVTQCLQSSQIEKSCSIDMIHSAWLLPTSWLRSIRGTSFSTNVLQLPLGYFMSSSLLYRAGIPSIIVPSSSPLLETSSCQDWLLQTGGASNLLNSVYPNVAEQELILQETPGHRIAVLLSDGEHATALLPLLCSLFNSKQYNVHVILTNGLTHRTFQDTLDRAQCTGHPPAMIHDLTLAYNNGVYYNDNGDTAEKTNYITPIANLLTYIGPDVLIHIKQPQNYMYRFLQTLTDIQGIASISLPAQEVGHALWIADLPVSALRHWNDIKIDLAVITDRRPQSLSRLLNSTNHAYYFGDDHVELAVHMEQSADTETQNLVRSFEFKHGTKKIRHRVRKGGLLPAIVESWYPADNDSYGVLLEDDIELSPYFYSWSKYNILKYRYSEDKNAYNHIYGVSLYSPRNLELLPEGRRPFNPEPVLQQSGYDKRAPYATQIPCSWGAVYFPEHWREFHAYLTERLDKEDTYTKGYYNITVPGSRSERWSKSWKKYLIQLTYLRAYVMVYPNFEHFESFSTNHLEYGTHVKTNGRTQSKIEQFLVPIMQRDTILEQLPGRRLPKFNEMPLMDLWGRVRTLPELEQVGASFHQQVSVCPARPIGSFDPTDILCAFPENKAKSKKKDTKKH